MRMLLKDRRLGRVGGFCLSSGPRCKPYAFRSARGEHPTLNVQHPTSNGPLTLARSRAVAHSAPFSPEYKGEGNTQETCVVYRSIGSLLTVQPSTFSRVNCWSLRFWLTWMLVRSVDLISVWLVSRVLILRGKWDWGSIQTSMRLNLRANWVPFFGASWTWIVPWGSSGAGSIFLTSNCLRTSSRGWPIGRGKGPSPSLRRLIFSPGLRTWRST